MAIEKLKIN